MRVIVLYHPRSEFARPVEEFAYNFERQVPGKPVELISLETRDGAATASLYDVVQYPAILALREDGQILKFWQGETMPLINEVASYAHS